MKVIDFLRLHAQCMLCGKPAILFFKDFKCEHNESLAHELSGDKVNLRVTQALFRNVKIDLSNNSYYAPSWSREPSKLAHSLNYKKIKIYKICECGFQIKTSSLNFGEDGYVNPLELEILTFKVRKSEYSYLNVCNDYKYKRTTVVDISIAPPYNSLIKGGYAELPLINFDTIDKEKIFRKIKTLITFS